MPPAMAVVELHVLESTLTRAWCPRCSLSTGLRAECVGVNPDTLKVWCRFAIHCCHECGLVLEQREGDAPDG